MAADDPIRVSDDELRHQDVMRSVVDRVQDTPYVLKGGTALLLARDLPRHSTDLDFDSGQKLNIDRRVREGIEAAGMEITRFSKVKDTDTVQRFKVHYKDPEDAESDDQFLKIETSFREEPDPASVEVVNGIRTYKLDDIYDQKLGALGDRTKPRDLFDLAHLTKEHGENLSDHQILRAEAATSNVDELANRFDESFREDPILARFGDAEDAVLEFREALETELRSRNLSFGSEVTPDDQNEAYAEIQESLNSDLYRERNAATMALFTQSDQRFDGVMQQLLPELENPRDVREVAAQLAENPHVVDAMENTISGQPEAAQRYEDIREAANLVRHDRDSSWEAVEPKLQEATPTGAEAVGGAVNSLSEIIHGDKVADQQAQLEASATQELEGPAVKPSSGMSP